MLPRTTTAELYAELDEAKDAVLRDRKKKPTHEPEDIAVSDMERRRGPRARWGVDGDRARRIRNLTDDSEKPLGEWNRMIIECRGRSIDVWLNGDYVNDGRDCTTHSGQIAIQAEGAAVEFRCLELTRLSSTQHRSRPDGRPAPARAGT